MTVETDGVLTLAVKCKFGDGELHGNSGLGPVRGDSPLWHCNSLEMGDALSH